MMAKLFQPEADDTLQERSLHVAYSKEIATTEKALRQPRSAARNCVVPMTAFSLGVSCYVPWCSF